MKKVVINGRFLSRPITGVERFGREVLTALDSLVARSNLGYQFEIVCPTSTAPDIHLTNIQIRKAGNRSGHIWEQLDLSRLAQGSTLVSLANCGPIFHNKHLVIIHDAAVFRNPDNYSVPYRSLHQGLGHALANTAHIATVSEFSRDELTRFLKPKRLEQTVVPNGVDHLLERGSEASVLARFDLKPNSYFLAVGSTSRTKNLAFLIDAWKRAGITDRKLVIAGGLKRDVFGAALEIGQVQSIVFTGRVSDEALTALYANSALFVAPSLYEGFGIPPLEALAFGCAVLASDIPAHREVCADQATYFDPRTGDDLSRALKRLSTTPPQLETRENAKKYASRFTWENSARRLLDCLDAI